MATLLLAKTLWWFGYGTSTYPCHTGAFSLNMRIAAVDVMKDNYYQYLKLPSRDKYPCHAKQWPTPTSLFFGVGWSEASGCGLKSRLPLVTTSILFEKAQLTFASTLRESTGAAYDLEQIGKVFIQWHLEGWIGFGADAINELMEAGGHHLCHKGVARIAAG